MNASKADQGVAEIAAQIGMGNDDSQYLTFMLAGEEYGVDILRVQEIKGWERVTPIPNTPEYIRGVINLRGAIVPIMDLRQRFSMGTLEYGPTTVVVVLRVHKGESESIMGIVVDAVSDVYNISEENLQDMPSTLDSIMTGSVRAIATVNDKMVILLDIDHLMDLNELSGLDSVNS